MGRRPKRFGYGTFSRPGEVSRDIEDARDRFLEAVEGVVPDVVRSLYETDDDLEGPIRDSDPPASPPFDCYHNLVARHGKRIDDDRIVRTMVAAPEPSPRAAALRDALSTWQQRWKLTPRWCRERVVQAMAFWSRHPTRPRRLARVAGSFWWRPAVDSVRREFVFEVSDRGWEPTVERRAAAEKRIRRGFERHLRAYLDELEAFVRSRGLLEAPRKQEPHHFTWLARHVVLGETYAAIAATAGARTTVAAVKQAIGSLARFIDLPLRGKAGRPRGARDTEPRQRRPRSS